MIRFVDRILSLYQKTLSPDHGILSWYFPYGYCRFVPSCSMYARRAIRKHGIFSGARRSIWRVFRCNPFSSGGHDSV